MADKGAKRGASTSPPRDGGSPTAQGQWVKKLTEGQREAAVTRLYDESLKHIKVQKEQLTRRVYLGEAQPHTISSSQLQESIDRQFQHEMERRETKAKTLKEKYYKAADPKTLPPDEIDASVQRISTEAVRHQQENKTRLETKYQFKRKAGRKLTPDETKESCTRLAQPHKHDYTDEQVNKILGFK
eukprot:Hpha_TRINITY_DN14948_c1_g2::TRINITY_DN14948_c1_g2_i1::g.144374::m.144374